MGRRCDLIWSTVFADEENALADHNGHCGMARGSFWRVYHGAWQCVAYDDVIEEIGEAFLGLVKG